MSVFLEKNWFKIAILVVFLIFGYYYFFVVVENEKLSKNIENCRIIGEKYRQSEIKENPNLSFFNPKYTYNTDLNICVYSGGFFDSSIKKNNMTKYIKNLNTNEEIVGNTYVDGEILFGVSNMEFLDREEEFFNLNKN